MLLSDMNVFSRAVKFAKTTVVYTMRKRVAIKGSTRLCTASPPILLPMNDCSAYTPWRKPSELYEGNSAATRTSQVVPKLKVSIAPWGFHCCVL